jgi:hypothetical protein
MDFVTVRLGGRDLAFAEHNRVRVPFTLPRPAAAVHAMLQSFRMAEVDSDRHLHEVQIRLVPFYNAGVSATTGELEFETVFSDSDGEILPTADLVEMEIVALLIAV